MVVKYVHIENGESYPDPIDLLLHLALLYFMPEGTKLQFYGKHMYIHENSYLQSTWRWLYGSNRKEITKYPISIAYGFTKFFDKNMINICNYSIKGLDNLLKTYKHDENAKYYVNICKDYIKNGLNNNYVFLFTKESDIKNIIYLNMKYKQNIFKLFKRLINGKNKKTVKKISNMCKITI